MGRNARNRMLGLVVCCAILLPGCMLTGRTYTAFNLPSDLQAQATSNPHTIDLSRLVTSTVSTEHIDVGDVLNVTISAGLGSEDTTTIPIRVSENGMANFPVLGSVQLAGLELEGAEQTISAASIYRGLYKAPHVTVTMNRQRQNRITVIGAVEKPGVYSLARGQSDLLSAIVAAGGLAKNAGVDVEIRQPPTVGVEAPPRGLQGPVAQDPDKGPQLTGFSGGGVKSIKVNLVSAAKEGNGGQTLPDGSVVMVERQDPVPLQVIGLVKKPGRYDFPFGKDLRVLDAIALAEGTSSMVADRVLVSRPVAKAADPAVIIVSIRQAKRNGAANLRLMPGDVLSVEQTPATVLLETTRMLPYAIGPIVSNLFF